MLLVVAEMVIHNRPLLADYYLNPDPPCGATARPKPHHVDLSLDPGLFTPHFTSLWFPECSSTVAARSTAGMIVCRRPGVTVVIAQKQRI
jgi:hypothetical protein